MTERKTDKRAAVRVAGKGYEARQAEMDAKYKQDYLAWVSSLSVEERDAAARRGLLEPDAKRCESSGREILDTDGSLYAPTPIESVAEKTEGEGGPSVAEQAGAIVRMALANFFYPSPGRSLQYEVDVVGIALGVPGLVGCTAIGRKHGVTKQAVSKAARKFCRELDLPPSHYMRSEENRETHRMVNKRRTA